MVKLKNIRIFEFNSWTPLIIQISATVLSLIGLLFIELSWQGILISFVFYFLYVGIGVGIMLHRYYTHRSFNFRNNKLKTIFTIFALLAGRGSILGWVYIHREHHAFSDTDRDPHSPKNIGWHAFLLPFYKPIHSFNKNIVKEFYTKNHLMINRFYLLIVIMYVILLALIDFWVLYYAWALPIAIGHFLLNAFTNLGHNVGYQNFNTRDNSKNCWPFAIFLFGEGWHNNHHHNPKNSSMTYKWWEFDLLGVLITMIKK
jgi:sn-1 stearoyl-lipid 9-desaturase